MFPYNTPWSPSCLAPYPPVCPAPAYPGGFGAWYALFIILLVLVLIFGSWWYFGNYFC